MPRATSSTSDRTRVKHATCPRYLELDYSCICIAPGLDDQNQPEVVWIASRALMPSSVIHREKKHRYQKACEEVERLNRLYAGKVQHFLLPVQDHL